MAIQEKIKSLKEDLNFYSTELHFELPNIAQTMSAALEIIEDLEEQILKLNKKHGNN